MNPYRSIDYREARRLKRKAERKSQLEIKQDAKDYQRVMIARITLAVMCGILFWVGIHFLRLGIGATN